MSDYELDNLFSKLTDIQTDPSQDQLLELLLALEKKLKRPSYKIIDYFRRVDHLISSFEDHLSFNWI